MSLVRLLGFSKLTCGCVVGRYREVPSERDVLYVEEKGAECRTNTHRQNHAVQIEAPPQRRASLFGYARVS